ncbi:MAG TPA: hypothetical protein PLT76_05265 [Candidatus Omnitrophota bacterium]|nr:hypothetical protein [Candidatus Omnitrophota bacterium]HPB68847.1 hypothetical protein [Candidatus Omnitrophota bacterium]HQO58111.1 hypothetical protein [Candidatus Omnitrophota bacterium]
MQKKFETASIRTIILFVILVPMILYLLHFAYKKNTESEARAHQCQVKCKEDGYPGYSFQWNILSGPQCECLGYTEE